MNKLQSYALKAVRDLESPTVSDVRSHLRGRLNTDLQTDAVGFALENLVSQKCVSVFITPAKMFGRGSETAYKLEPRGRMRLRGMGA